MVHAVLEPLRATAPKSSHTINGDHRNIPISTTSHPDNPVPEEPRGVQSLSFTDMSFNSSASYSSQEAETSTDSDTPSTPATELQSDTDELAQEKTAGDHKTGRQRSASTVLISQNAEDMRRILENVSIGGTQKVQPLCCGGGCCRSQPLTRVSEPVSGVNIVTPPENQAYRDLNLKVDFLTLDSELTNVVGLPEKTVSFSSIPASAVDMKLGPADHPPPFVQPHPPYNVYRAPLYHARELTKPGAEKRTYHFDIDVTDYPAESGMVDFVVGGAIGVCPRNKDEEADDIFNQLGIPKAIRDKKISVRTTKGRWPTIWGDDKPRELITTRRELLNWCADIQSYAPTKALFRLLAEYNSDPNEKQILMFLSSAQGQGAFCDLRTGSHVTVSQLLHAFPSSQPPLDHLLSALNTLMPRFYSLSQDPLLSCTKGAQPRRLVEVAVSVAESKDWKGGMRTGVGSGYLEKLARRLIDAEKKGIDPRTLNLHVPMFRGLMANPLAKRFASDGPMLLIGAGVGVAPFRGFVQRRLQSANCANKVWVLQGVRDSLLDELYRGEWGVDEEKVRTVVQSRRGESKYVQEEVRHQADLVWFVINALDGRVFVCGSSKGMGEGVEAALVDVAMAKGNLNEEEARQFWENKKEAGQYIAETW
ncbi:FAD binding domain protein [Aspergillus tanneri]|uniref:FAD-binding FR-type domain-containing protein n=1 Tax=Aspergillus tanneri TaxID=1220188 RepID=A0A5M9MU04_9EURO|nr:uncharacterized protein ATNIH1004_004730 [Aspergillus tanneri]KAA8648844.1 hypothetical protein ATNIH1004_004730 [Aspergillus tanneri]